MLTLLLLIPLIGAIYLLLLEEKNEMDKLRIKNISLITSLINFLFSIFLWTQFDNSVSDYQFTYEFTTLSFCHLHIGVDGLNLFYILLTTFITPIAILSNYNNINNNVRFFSYHFYY